jgi:hypothetical protein
MGTNINNNAVFYHIGLDETEIPIVVTRIGPGSAAHKLVIAGPHGDERNAQRVIMKAQQYFIQQGPPDDTALYFIPCLSPTMCFADARGIPNRFWEGGDGGGPLENGPFVLKGGLTIPELHEAMQYTKRSQIQGQTNSSQPRYGIDANRDYYLSLPSNKEFLRFIKLINPVPVQGYNMNEDDHEKREIIAASILKKNIRVLMIHGYDSTGKVYCPYWVDASKPKWEVATTEADRNHVDLLMAENKLNMGTMGTNINNYIWSETRTMPEMFLGEWSRRLYVECLAWSCDIELNKNLPNKYDEGVRESPPDDRSYTPLSIGNTDLPYFQKDNNGFYNLLRNYPWS